MMNLPKLNTCCLFLVVFMIAHVTLRAHAQTYTGIATLFGQAGTFYACPGGGAGCTSTPASGVIGIQFASPNVTYTVSASFGNGLTTDVVAANLCAQFTSYVQCTGVTQSSPGYYDLALTSNLSFTASPVIHLGTNGGRGTVTVYNESLNIAAPNWVIVQPKYYVLDLLYAPPGNTSTAGFSNGTTQSTTTMVGNNFMSGTSVGYSVSLGFGGSRITTGTTSGTSSTTVNTSAFSTSLQTNTGSTLKSVEDPIDHTQDQFWLLLNPEIVAVEGASGVIYSVATPDNAYADVVNVSVRELQNPTLIPLSVLETQTDPITGLPLPGLKNVCAQPLPDNACTNANACGCTASDFSGILPLDVLLNSPNTSPVTLDNSRFAYVSTITLEGPACSSCDPVTNTYGITDSNMSSQTTGGSQSYSVGYSAGNTVSLPLGIAQVTSTFSSSFSWTNTYSFGASNGTSHSETVTLGTSGVGCYQNYDVYQDGEFHTFAFYPVSPSVPAC